MTTKPKPPPGTGAGGRRLWRSVADAYELDEHERAVLVECVRTVDLLDALDAAIRRDGPLTDAGRAHPAAAEARQQRIVLARLLAALRLPTDDETGTRPQRRVGVRGVRVIQ
ncbi:MAG: terminase [Geodermatophilaceae bacterium]|nr:terminase [Geodermatophilaceae bacterium]